VGALSWRMDGLFITFEGAECSGKSTQTQMLAAWLRASGKEVIETRDPGGTRVGEELRHIVKHVCGEDAVCDEAELLIFGASRAQLTRKIVIPCLARGGIVICDRFADSTTAYQGYGRGFDLSLIRQINKLATCERMPDLTILLDIDAQTMGKRGQMRMETLFVQDRIEDESRRFHEAVRNGYLEIARNEPDRIKVIPGVDDPNNIQTTIREHVNHALDRIQG
jgi:dTMP kinase